MADQQQKNAGRRRPAWWQWGLLLLFGLPALGASWLASYALAPGPEVSGAAGGEKTVFIPRHTGFAGIREILTTAAVIPDDSRFLWLAAVTGMTTRLQAGEYVFAGRPSPYQVLTVLASGQVVRRLVTIPEGTDIFGVARILAQGGWVEENRFLALVRDPAFISDLGLAVSCLEGYLFPDTYALSRGAQDARAIIRMMVDRGRRVFAEIGATATAQGDFSQHEILTLASIIEKETGRPEERPVIAGVFLNRLRQGMRLQADPTVLYGRPDAPRDLSRADLRQPSRYNTYLIKGLPPGPIANPGRPAIEAVLQPAPVAYLYFVARQDGSHHFSETLTEHNQAVARYRAGF